MTKVKSPHGTRTIIRAGRVYLAICDNCGQEVARGTALKHVKSAAESYSSRHDARHKGLPDPYPHGGIW